MIRCGGVTAAVVTLCCFSLSHSLNTPQSPTLQSHCHSWVYVLTCSFLLLLLLLLTSPSFSVSPSSSFSFASSPFHFSFCPFCPSSFFLLLYVPFTSFSSYSSYYSFSASSFSSTSFNLSAVEPTWPQLVNPCYSGSHDCDTTAQCVPLEGQAFRCQCATGYRGDGRNCYGAYTSTHSP